MRNTIARTMLEIAIGVGAAVGFMYAFWQTFARIFF